MTRSLTLGSASAARNFLESSQDPFEYLSSHFKDIIGWIKQPVAVFIDDLDRCQGSYAVELLEGIQTLFKDANVFYVVAADRRWLKASYHATYDAFTETVKEPGRPLGYLFLEKTFQLSISLPRLSYDLQERYWLHLIQIKQSENKDKLQIVRDEAREKVKKLQTEEDIIKEMQMASENPYYDQALREAAIVRLVAPEIEQRTEHTLKPLARLLEPNPRAMKRLVNAYSIQRSLDILRGGIMPREQLALWTIIVLRWPELAEFLEENPEKIKFIGNDHIPDNEIPDDLQPLFMNKAVCDVIEGKGFNVSLGE